MQARLGRFSRLEVKLMDFKDDQVVTLRYATPIREEGFIPGSSSASICFEPSFREGNDLLREEFFSSDYDCFHSVCFQSRIGGVKTVQRKIAFDNNKPSLDIAFACSKAWEIYQSSGIKV